MKVKCIFNVGKDLPGTYLNPKSGYDLKTEFSLIENKEYVVYGITNYTGGVWYYLCDEDYDLYNSISYPIWKPSPLFEVVDSKISRYWNYRSYKDSNSFLLAFKEWAENPSYYEQLIDGDPGAVFIFQNYKKTMDAEANIEQEVDAITNILSKPLEKADRDNGWYDGSQKEILNLFLRLQSDLRKNCSISENTEYLNLLKTVESLGVDTGDLYELLVRISDYIKSLKSVDTQ